MNWIESIFIIGGISLDIFAAMELKGAMFSQVKRRTLLNVSGLVVLLQMIFFFGGYFVCYELAEFQIIANAERVGYIAAVVLLAALGCRLVIRAIRIKYESIHEKRCDHISVKDYVFIIAQTSFYMIFAGCTCGLIKTMVPMLIIIIIVASILVVVGGLYTGYHFGVNSRTVTYAIGAVLLWAVGLEILIRDVLQII